METEQVQHWKMSWLRACEEGRKRGAFLRGFVLLFSPVDFEDGSAHWAAVDQEGYIPSRETWNEIAGEVSKFYKAVSSERVDEHNLELDARHFGPRVRSPSQPTVSKRKSAGYVYVLRAEGGLYKIGLSKHPEERIKSLSRESPYELEVVCIMPSGAADTLERTLHSMFEDKRAHGEWFKLEPSDVGYLVAVAESLRLAATSGGNKA